jgi:hypothetical protein
LRNGWAGDGKVFCNLARAKFLFCDDLQNGAAVGFGDGSDDGVHIIMLAYTYISRN